MKELPVRTIIVYYYYQLLLIGSRLDNLVIQFEEVYD